MYIYMKFFSFWEINAHVLSGTPLILNIFTFSLSQNPVKADEKPKRPRGRPKKNPAPAEADQDDDDEEFTIAEE